ncbi:MAG TPA: M23 family metallopeptidase [Longimicrobiales bacterium]|nr:M23 family metallopeptidase [Longimicrobiales bacterium]
MALEKRVTRLAVAFACAAGLSACGSAPPRRPITPIETPPPSELPDTAFGTHVLILARSPHDRALWVGTYGRGIFATRTDSTQLWRRIVSARNDSASISWNFINSISFGEDSTIWYGTVGNGFGRSNDGGRTWRNWTFDQLGPEWQYVAADGIRTRGDTVYIATADGLRVSTDNGQTFLCVQAISRVAGGSTAGKSDACNEKLYTLPTEYLLSLDVSPQGELWVGHLFGLSVSTDQGRTWRNLGERDGVPRTRVRAITAADTLGRVWIATERDIYRRADEDSAFARADLRLPGWPTLPGGPRALIPSPGSQWPIIATSFGLASADLDGAYHLYYLPAGEQYRPAADIWDMTWWGPPTWPIAGTAIGLSRILAGEQLKGLAPGLLETRDARDPAHAFFARPIRDDEGNPHIDATYRYGSTMGGNFQQHQGIEFNNPAGTQVRAVGAGTVAFAGPAEAGALTVAILHDRQVNNNRLYSVYYHNTALNVRVGQRVNEGDVIARVGNTGRATNDHLHLEVHVTPGADSAAVVNPQERYPRYSVNPQLWIRPLPGTGIVAGRVRDAQGNPIPGARIHGLVLPYPEETPFSFVETYRDRAHSSPGYDEDFAIGDVPAGTYLLGVEIQGQRVWRRIRVQPERVTFVEFGPS